ncbi:MAG: hypothetical protein ABL949_01710 [Fimbriimonadaceae bacterium]
MQTLAVILLFQTNVSFAGTLLGAWVRVQRPRSHHPRLLRAQVALWAVTLAVVLAPHISGDPVFLLYTWVVCNVISFFIFVAQLWHWRYPRQEVGIVAQGNLNQMLASNRGPIDEDRLCAEFGPDMDERANSV